MDYSQLTLDEIIEQFRRRVGNSTVFNKIENSQIYPIFIEFLSECCNLSNFYIQRTAEERSIADAKFESNVIKHCQNLGYQPRRPIPAQAELTIRLKGPFPAELNQPGTEIFFTQDQTDLVYNGFKFKLDSSYSYVLSQEDIDYCHDADWQKNLIAAVPHTNSIYLPLQGANLVNVDNMTAIKCFQGEIKTHIIEGSSILEKLGRFGQTFNIYDKTFSNWYGKRDPYAYNGDRNYVQKNSWCKVGIGTTKENAFADDVLFDIETQSIKLNKKYRNIDSKNTKYLESLIYDVVTHNKTLDKKYKDNAIKEIITNQLRICTITSNPDESVKISFGHNYNVISGLMRPTDNLYVQYVSTQGKSANQAGIINSVMNHNNRIYASVNGNILDITDNIEFVLTSDIYGGDDFESMESMKINGPAYYRRRNKLIMMEDFQNYFSTITSPMYVNTAYAAGQQEMEESQVTTLEFPLLQNYIAYTLLGRVYLQNSGDFQPRNVLTQQDTASEPYSIYGPEYRQHLCDYLKFLISPIGFANKQYDKYPTEQWVKNVQLIRENCKDNLPMNTTLLSLPPFIQYFDLVGSVNVKPTTDIQEYSARLKNKVYSFLNYESKKTQKVYKSDIIKIYADDPDTLSVDIDIKVSSLIKAPETIYEWRFEDTKVRDVLILDKGNQTYKTVERPNDLTAFNIFKLPLLDITHKKVSEVLVNGSRVKLQVYYRNNWGSADSQTWELSNEAIIGINPENPNQEMIYLITPVLCDTLNPNVLTNISKVKLTVTTQNDFAATSKFNSIRYTDYKLPQLSESNPANGSPDPVSAIGVDLIGWLDGLKETRGADRAIDLPYKVRIGVKDLFAREESITRKGNLIGEAEHTLSESSFWNYFAPKIINKYYVRNGKPVFEVDSLVDSDEWLGAEQLIYDLYALVKAGICDSILDDNNNITNFSLGTEAAVVINKVNITQR